jgi:lipid-binding SYLF domain-containing protein
MCFELFLRTWQRHVLRSDQIAVRTKGIPRDPLEKAQCVVIVPGLKKAAFLVGGDYALCRHAGGWSGPAAIKFGGGSFGAQIGAESTGVVMLVMDRKGMERLAADKFTVGADASASAGPVGRTASQPTPTPRSTPRFFRVRAHGVFAGIALDGEVPPPPAASVLTSVLAPYPHKEPRS